jgi:uncharacterized protein (DUF1330 family)
MSGLERHPRQEETRMPAYVIFFVDEINEPDGLNAYKKAAFPSLVAAGGKPVIAYGKQEVVEGAPMAGVVTLEFPTFETASTWYHSPEYAEAKKLRENGVAVCRAVIVEGR